ncbi:zinc finger protein 142-like [Sitodiplosis mosellana]|uniref:zinc finger protein 142-like n=1 Tax=Sitodiplosis mosellana TaxID=263140 RepID=UPI0024452764|nr:zinc finger protein 142-like [Sitodiplosis mosellana]
MNMSTVWEHDFGISKATPVKRKHSNEGEAREEVSKKRKHGHKESHKRPNDPRRMDTMRENMNSTGKSYKFIIEEERYKCGVASCGHQSKAPGDFERHLKEMHGIIKRFKCPHCNDRLEASNDRNRMCTPVDVMRHLELHGNDLFSCFHCQSVFSTEFEVQLHLIRRHLTLEFKYHHKNFDAKGQASVVDDVNVKFECNMCHQHVPTTALAMEHFKMSHTGANVDFTAIQFVDRMTRSLEVVSIPVHRAFLLQQHLICASCDSTLATKERLIAHHRQKHDTRPLAIRLSPLMCFNNFTASSVVEMTKMNSQFDRHIMYTCAHCPETGTYFSKVEDVLTHWSKTHETEDQLPFRFHAIPLVACIHCQTLSTFHDLVRHHAQKHSNQPFVAVNPINQNQCSVCNFVSDNLIDHFCLEHSTILQENIMNPVCLSEGTVNQLLEINVRKNFKCGRCDTILETENDMKDHYLDEHKTLEFDRIEFNDNQSVQLLGGCCHLDLDQITFFEHLANHERNFCCPKCTFHTSDSFEFMDHGIEAHEIHNDACTLDLNNMKTWYWNSRYVFGNGLVLSKYNLIGTSIDDSQRFKEFAQTFVAEREKSHYKKL